MISQIEQHRPELAQLCRRFKARRLAVFGSAAKGSFSRETSDLDFLVKLDAASPAEYADNYFGLAHALEELFQRKVDLVTAQSIRNPYFLQGVNQTRRLIYAA